MCVCERERGRDGVREEREESKIRVWVGLTVARLCENSCYVFGEPHNCISKQHTVHITTTPIYFVNTTCFIRVLSVKCTISN